MKRIKVKIGIIGYLPFEFNRKLIKNWKSDIFEIVDDIEEYHFTNHSDTFSWGYSDRILNMELPQIFDGELFIGITYVPIEDNFYARRLESNRIVLSYFEMYQILKHDDLPMENLLLRVLYAYCLVYLRNNHTIPQQNEWLGFTHDDTRGCLFDMNGNKSDVVFSLNSPKICDDCTNRIRAEKVSDNYTNQIKKEIKRIKKKKFYKISDFIKKKPLLSLLFSAIFGILISIAASAIYETIKKEMKPDVNIIEKLTHSEI
ncbi:MAG: hypothetical protein VB105_04745 [Paludibacter sp.]|jgi:hypothetical protein|nr:hypothetical protein [Paludibacter sp.]